MLDQSLGRGFWRKRQGELPARGHIGKNQESDLTAVVPRNDDVLGNGRQRGNRLDAEHSNVHPRPGIKFEILGYSAIEQKAPLWPIRINELECIADLVESLFVEHRTSEIRSFPVPRT